MARWLPSGTAYDADAQWQVYGNTAGSPLYALPVDLNRAPHGLPDGSGLMWQSLGAHSPHVNGGSVSLTVKLTDTNNNGRLVIDAVRLVEVGPVKSYEFDHPGNLVATRDENGNVTSYSYDELNRLEQVIEPDPDGAGTGDPSPVTTYTYNKLGWLSSTTDAENRVTAYRYDTMGRQIAEIREGDVHGLTAQYYDPAGSVTTFPDFDSLTPVHSRIDSQVNLTTATGDLGGFTDLDDDVAALWTGAIYIAAAGSVTFQLTSNDGSRLLY